MPRTLRLSLILAFAFAVPPSVADAQWPYPPYAYGVSESSLRFSISPKSAARTATVYIDGYLAGPVDDYDGAFQRLHLPPGHHEVVVYLEGYRSIKQDLYLSPNATRKIEGTLERISPGEPPEAPPVPSQRPEPRDQSQGPPARGPVSRRGAPPPQSPPPRPDRSRERPEALPVSRFGALSVQVQPSGADVLIDGERWEGPASGDERLIIQVSEGHHRVDVRKAGYDPFVLDVDVRRGETAPVNVSLSRSR